MKTTGTKALGALAVALIAGAGLVGCSAEKQEAQPQTERTTSTSAAKADAGSSPGADDTTFYTVKGDDWARTLVVEGETAYVVEYACKDDRLNSFGWLLGLGQQPVDTEDLAPTADGSLVYEGVTYTERDGEARVCS